MDNANLKHRLLQAMKPWLKFFLILGVWLSTTAHVTISNPVRDPGLVAGHDVVTSMVTSLNLDAFQAFRASLTLNGQADQPIGLYADGVMAYPIVQQPASNPGFVSTQPDTLTHFALAQRYGSLGLLAHNNLAGHAFFNLQPEQTLWVIFGDGSIKRYRIAAIERYQALQPRSPYSSFINLDDPERKVLSASELFLRIYDNPGALVLQTCIAQGDELSWGRLFVIAFPEDSSPRRLPQ
ncbi:MAG: hypothetical protein N3A60_02480 [Thermanaerothrix sp.]|nr:hypothetical protein [Thermanaerothrix sp.]